MSKERKRICLNSNDEDTITEYLEKGYDVILTYSYEPPRYPILVNVLHRKINKLDEYLHKMLNSTTGKYHEAIQDTIYFLNTLKEHKDN